MISTLITIILHIQHGSEISAFVQRGCRGSTCGLKKDNDNDNDHDNDNDEYKKLLKYIITSNEDLF